MAFLNNLFAAAFDSNLVFAQLIGMVAVIVAAERPQDSFRLGGAVWLVSAIAGIIDWVLYTGFLVNWGVGYLSTAVYVLVACAVATVVAVVKASEAADKEAVLKGYGIVALCSAVLAVPALNGAAYDAATLTTLDAALGACVGYGAGFFIAVVVFAFVHQRIDETMVPQALRGLPISLITLAIMALAFTGVAGVAAGMFA